MLVEMTSFLFCRICEELTPSAMLDSIDNVDCKIGIRCKTLAVFARIALAVRIHDLPSSNLGDKSAERRRGSRSFIYRHHLFWSWDKTSFVTTLAELINGHIFELWKMNPIAENIQLLFRD